jgi:hypothetical protein
VISPPKIRFFRLFSTPKSGFLTLGLILTLTLTLTRTLTRAGLGSVASSFRVRNLRKSLIFGGEIATFFGLFIREGNVSNYDRQSHHHPTLVIMASSFAKECTEFKHKYDNCFIGWYANKCFPFAALSTAFTFNESCGADRR